MGKVGIKLSLQVSNSVSFKVVHSVVGVMMFCVDCCDDRERLNEYMVVGRWQDKKKSKVQ